MASCVQCGAILKNADSRKKKFCSAKCRMAWWNTHQEYVMRTAYYSFVCPQCGKTFTAYGNAKRVYCSRECFAVARKKEVINYYEQVLRYKTIIKVAVEMLERGIIFEKSVTITREGKWLFKFKNERVIEV